MHVTDRRVEEHAADEGEDRVADPAMRPHHGAGLDAAREAIAEHEVVSLPQAVDQRLDGGEVVAVVGVAHDHETTADGFDAADQRAAVALARDVDHGHAKLARYVLRTVGASVVGDDDLSRQAVPFDRRARLADAGGERLRLVEAGHNDRDLDRGGGSAIAMRADALRDAHGWERVARGPARSCPEKQVTPTDRLSGAGTRPCDLIPAPSYVSLGAVEKGKGSRANAQGPNIGSPPTYSA
jgi:hypothetical protein